MGNDQIKVQAKISNIIISVILVAAVILIILNFRLQKSALEKCADGGVLYIWGDQNAAYNNKSFKVKMEDDNNFKDFPYKKLYEICSLGSQQNPKLFEEKWGK